METLEHVDLAHDPAAAAYVKDETVDVVFATRAGEILSREGVNRYRAGDALITGSAGERWSVSRDRFDARYLPAGDTPAGTNGPYRAKPAVVLAKQWPQAFSIARSAGGDLLRGNAGDWLLQYAPGDYGLIENARFQRVYRRLPG
ncbi:MAG: PGDYG domain-containing protein [Betaproteobacteria bacterium]